MCEDRFSLFIDAGIIIQVDIFFLTDKNTPMNDQIYIVT